MPTQSRGHGTPAFLFPVVGLVRGKRIAYQHRGRRRCARGPESETVPVPSRSAAAGGGGARQRGLSCRRGGGGGGRRGGDLRLLQGQGLAGVPRDLRRLL